MVVKTIQESSYAVFNASGKLPDCLLKTWETIWKQKDLKRTYIGDFELYKANSPQEVEVFIGITN